MTRKYALPAAVVAALGAAFALTAASGVADAATVPQGAYTLTMSTQAGASYSVTLYCQPDGGTHPGDIAAACGQLAKANGVVADIPEEAGMLCTKQYDPVTVRAVGEWATAASDYVERFGNSCEANAATGGQLFNFAD
jgi:hypothetical protein